MATKIIHKKSSVAASVPASGDIEAGELAVNLADKKLYSKQTDGTIIAVGVSNYNDLENLPADFTPEAHTHVKADITDFNEDDYVSVTGDVMSGNLSFGDNDKAIFGAGSDLQIFHDGADSIIQDFGTGDLKLIANTFKLYEGNGTDLMIGATPNGAVTLSYDASTKLSTTSTGIDVTGTVTADGLTVDGNILLSPEGSEIKFSTSSTPVNKIYTDDTYVSNGFTVEGPNGITLKSDNNYLVLDDTVTNEMVLNVDSGERMRVTSTGIYVTGTVTADGLNLDGNIQGDSGQNMQVSAGAGAGDKLDLRAGDDVRIWVDGATAHKISANFANNGDVSLYEDTGTTAKFFWDASAESLGIGNSSPATALDVTGQITADGLTVDGDGLFDSDTAKVTVKSFRPKLILDDDSAVGAGSDKLIIQSASAQSAGDYEFVLNNDQTSSADQTAIKISGNGDISFYEDTGTTAKFFWDASTERLGLNSTSPTSTLTVNGQADFQASGTTVLSVEGGATNAIIGAKNSRKLKLQTAATTRLNIDDNGDLSLYEDTGTTAKFFWDASAESLGIGTTSPVAKLHVENGDIRIEKDTKATIGFKGHTAGSTALAFRDSNAGIDRMVINSSGNVGIGTASPSNVLHVKGENQITLEDTSSGNIGQVYAANTATVISSDPSNSVANSSIVMHVDGSEAVRIDSSGRVGVGTTSPSRQLHVSGSGANTRLRVENTTGSNVLDVYAEDSGNSTLNYSSVFTMSQSGTERMRIDSSGNLLVGTTDATPYDNTTGEGIALKGDNIQVARQSATPMFINRMGTDGDLVDFRKDGATVGSIGTKPSEFAVTSEDTFLTFLTGGLNDGLTYRDDATQRAFRPYTTKDGDIDLGASNARFKDLYLSEKVNLTDAALEAEAGTTSSTTETTIATFPKADFDAAKFVVMANDGTDTFCCEILVVHDGTAASATEYAQVSSDDSFQPFYEVDISGNDVRLRATAQNTTSTTYKVMKTLL